MRVVAIIAKYKKAVVGSLGVIVSAYFSAVAGDGALTTSEFANLVALASTTISLAVAPNTPGAKYTKSIIAAVGALAAAVISVWSGGISQDELSQIVVAVGTALGVREVGNVGDQYDRMTNVTVQ